MSSTQHIIRRLTFEVSIPSEEKGFAIQQSISDTFNSILERELEYLLDKADSRSEVISIDRLEIDLGFIDESSFESDITGKIREHLEAKLREVITSAHLNNHGQVQQGDQQASVTFKPISKSKLDLLLHFLQTGTMPWWARNEERSVSVLVVQLIEESPAQLREALEKLLRNSSSRKRFIYQLQDSLIAEVMKLYGSSFSQFAAAAVNDLCMIHSRNSFTSLSSQSLRLQCWSYFINELTEKNTGMRASEKAAHLQKLITQLQPNGDALLFVIRKARQMQDEQLLRIDDLADLLVIAKQQAAGKSKEKGKKGITKKDDKRADENVNDHESAKASDTIEEQLKKAFGIEDNEPVNDDLAEGIYINNAGLVIVWPYILPFFRKLGLVSGNEFVSDDARHRAVHILQHLVTGEDAGVEEHELVLNKILCGISPEVPISGFTPLHTTERDECEELLSNIIENWSALKNISTSSLRSTFLMKEGILKRNNGWLLQIERTTVDMLIDRLPWGISMIKLPWNDEMIYVEW